MALELQLSVSASFTRVKNKNNSPDVFAKLWNSLTILEQQICQWVAQGNNTFYDGLFASYANQLGNQVSNGKIQDAL